MNAMRVVLGFALFAALPAWAQKLDQLQNLTQQEFRSLSEDMGAVLSYRPQIPTTPLGITGFDIGVGLSAAKLKHVNLYDRATTSTASVGRYLLVPSVRVHKGLPWGVDVGVAYAKIPDSNLNYAGGELRVALVQGNVAVPAIGLRGSYTRLSGVDQYRVDTFGADLSISKGFTIFTPYAGIGQLWIESDPRGVATLRPESFSMTKYFGGIGLKFGLFNLNFEADRTGDVTGYSGKVSLRF
jgi:hypothetical protein